MQVGYGEERGVVMENVDVDVEGTSKIGSKFSFNCRAASSAYSQEYQNNRLLPQQCWVYHPDKL